MTKHKPHFHKLNIAIQCYLMIRSDKKYTAHTQKTSTNISIEPECGAPSFLISYVRNVCKFR